MARFYGTLKGRGKTDASRCGTASTGIIATAAGRHGAIQVSLFDSAPPGSYASVGHRDWAIVEMVPWKGVGNRCVLHNGPVDTPMPRSTVVAPEPEDTDDMVLVTREQARMLEVLGFRAPSG